MVSVTSGCKNPKKPVTPIPNAPYKIQDANPVDEGPSKVATNTNKGGNTSPSPSNDSNSGRLGGSDLNGGLVDDIKIEDVPNDGSGFGQASRDFFEGRPMDREIFAANTVHFSFDSSEVRPSDAGNVKTVADYLVAHPNCALLIEGHCDVRGTEEYNQALGERRALSVRESVVKNGVEAGRIRTISYGESQPVSDGTSEADYQLCRRGVFILLGPKDSGSATDVPLTVDVE